MNDNNFHITIVGGGVTGLAAAFYLQKHIEDRGLLLDFTLLEASSRLGGKVQTDFYDGFVMEKGPDSFLERKKSATELVRDLGLQNKLVRNRTGQSYILHRDELLPIPAGAVMGIPTALKPLMQSRLITLRGKLRAVADLFLPHTPVAGDQSVGHFFRKRFGDDIVDHLIEPLLSGIYAGNIDTLSLMATFPQFYQLEQQYRSLILAMKKTRTTKRRGEMPQGQFLTLKDGLQSIVNAIEARLPAKSIMKNSALRQIEKYNGRYRLYLDGNRTIDTDAVILAVPSPVAQRTLGSHQLLQPLSRIPATSVANVVLAYPKDAVRLDQDGTGFLVPRTADYTITACTWTHKKWPHTAPPGKALLRCYVGRAGADSIVHQSDDTIVQTVLSDLKRISNIDAQPEFYRISRWHNAMPQYAVGHRQKVQKAQEQLAQQFAGIVLAGASYEGVGLPDCIDQGKKAVNDVISHLL